MLALLATCAIAQSTARPRPPGTLPLEEIPPPPPMPITESATVDLKEIESRSQVTTRVEGEQTVQEYRVNGKLYMTRVTPKYGRPYVLMDQRGDGTFTRMDTLEPSLRVPQWVLFEF
jgi:hypothetical protein